MIFRKISPTNGSANVVLIYFAILCFLFAWCVLFVFQNAIHGRDLFLTINSVFIVLLFLLFLFFFNSLKFDVKLLLSAIIALLLFYQTSTSILINVDRSRSFYVLSWINTYEIDSELSKSQFDQIRSPEKSSLDSINKRISEQVSRGLVFKSGEGLELTIFGRACLHISDFFAKWFKLNGWYQNKY